MAVGTYLAARIVGTWELYLLAFALLAIPLVAWVLMLASRDSVTVTRTLHPAQPTAGSHLSLFVHLRNGSFLPGPQIAVGDAAGDLDPSPETVESESLAPHGRRTLEVPLRPARRGVHRLPPLRVETHDPLGLVRSVREEGEEQTIVVYPRLAVLDSCLLLAEVGDHERVKSVGLPSSGGLEFRGIRPYNPGEPLNRVDWKATARSGSLMLRETDDPANGDVTIVLDGAAAAVAGELPETSFELAVEAAAAIGAYLLLQGRTVVLIRHQSAPETARVTPGAGSRETLLERLAEARADARMPVEATLASPRGGPAPDRPGTLVLVTSALNAGLARALTGLARRGLVVSVLYVDPASFRAGSSGSARSDGRPGEAGGVQLMLVQAGVRCLTVARGDDLRESLSRHRRPAKVAAS